MKGSSFAVQRTSHGSGRLASSAATAAAFALKRRASGLKIGEETIPNRCSRSPIFARFDQIWQNFSLKLINYQLIESPLYSISNKMFELCEHNFSTNGYFCNEPLSGCQPDNGRRNSPQYFLPSLGLREEAEQLAVSKCQSCMTRSNL